MVDFTFTPTRDGGVIRPGFEMLVNNFSAGILAAGLAVVGFYVFGPADRGGHEAFGSGVNWLIEHSLLPLASIIIEPAKVLFLNNAINQGVLTPLGVIRSLEEGKSILFLLEANPGPGLGVLIAYSIFGTGLAKSTAPAAAIIQFFGGIHEIYFPYVLMKPITLLGDDRRWDGRDFHVDDFRCRVAGAGGSWVDHRGVCADAE